MKWQFDAACRQYAVKKLDSIENLWTNNISWPVGGVSYDAETQAYTIPTGVTKFDQLLYTLPEPIPAGTTITVTAFFESGYYDASQSALYVGGVDSSGSWQAYSGGGRGKDLANSVVTRTRVTTEPFQQLKILLADQSTVITKPIKFRVVFSIGDTPAEAFRPYGVHKNAWIDGLKSSLPSVKILGQTKQKSWTGKNLFDINRIQTKTGAQTYNYFSYIGPDYVVLSLGSNHGGAGYTNTGATLRQLAPNLVAGSTYTFSFHSESANQYIYLSSIRKKWADGESKTIDESMLNSTVIFYGMAVDKGDPLTDCVISRIQIEEGTDVTDYEPYTNGMVSPSPLYPQEVHANNAAVTCTNADGTYDGGTATAPDLMCAVDGSCQSTYDPQTGEFVNWWWDKITLNGSEKWGTYPAYQGFYLQNALPETMNQRTCWSNMSKPGRNMDFTKECLVCGVGNTLLYSIHNPFYDSALKDEGLANWKAHLAEHPLELWVARSKPEITNIGAQRLTCPTGYGQIIQVAGDIPDCPMEIKYLAHGGNVK